MNLSKFSTSAISAILRILLFVFNIICFIIGIGLIFGGRLGLEVFQINLQQTLAYELFIPVIIIGVIATIGSAASILIWCTPKELPKVLFAYGSTVFMFFLTILFLLITLLLKLKPLEGSPRYNFDWAIKKYPEESHLIDNLQSRLQCCGCSGLNDWLSLSEWTKKNGLPNSCCHGSDCGKIVLIGDDYSRVYQEGCCLTLFKELNNAVIIQIQIGACIMVFFLIGSIVACLLASHSKRILYNKVNQANQLQLNNDNEML